MTGFIRSKLGQALATLILITATVAVPLASSIISSHAASPVGATSQSTHQLSSFSPNGQGSVVPRNVSTIYPSIWYVNQTLSGTQTLASGAGHYGTIGTARWGDYQSAWLDPTTTSPNSIWIIGQYAKANNLWGTKVGRVTT